MIHVLQAAAIFLRPRISARKHQDRRARDMRVGDAGDCVGHAGTRGDHRNAKLAGELGMRLRHMNGRAFVANIDDLDAFGIQSHPDRHDMAAAQREDAFDTAPLQQTCDQVGGAIRQDFHVTTPSC